MNTKTFISTAVVVMVAVALVTAFTFQSAPSAKDASIADWERAKAYTVEYLNASTDASIAFKPTPEMRSFAQQMLHLADANFGFSSLASGKASPYGRGQLEQSADQYASKDALLKIVSESYDFVIAALKETDEVKLKEVIKVFNRFDLSREATFQKAFEHQTHHRGQTTVYLRLSGITPPNEKLF